MSPAPGEKRRFSDGDVSDQIIKFTKTNDDEKSEGFYLAGCSDFSKLVETDYFVDKSLFLKDLLYSKVKSVLVTAPRRFGKSTNLSMIRHFFNLTEEEMSKPVEEKRAYQLFKNLKLFKETSNVQKIRIRAEMGSRPVVHISFKIERITVDCYESAEHIVRDAVHKAIVSHESVIEKMEDNSKKLILKKWIDEIQYETFDRKDFIKGIELLTERLRKFYNRTCVVCIDEYDFISNRALHQLEKDKLGCMSENKCLTKITSLVTDIINHLTKENDFVERAVVTGISRMTSYDISGSAVTPFGFLSPKFGVYYGFTPEECNNLLIAHNLSPNGKAAKQIKAFYNGYGVGDRTVYNPWSLLEYLIAEELKRYWCRSSLVLNFDTVFKVESFRKDMMKLLSDEDATLEVQFMTNFSNGDLAQVRSIAAEGQLSVHNTNIFYNFLVENGYLTIVENDQRWMKIKIPNLELHEEFSFLFDRSLNLMGINLAVLKNCGSLMDELFKTSFNKSPSRETMLSEFARLIEEVLKPVKEDELNESCLHSVLYVAMKSATSINCFSNKRVGCEASSGVLDIAVYDSKYYLIIEAKFDKKDLTGLKQIIDQEYRKIFDCGSKHFPVGRPAENYILMELTLATDKTIRSFALFDSVDTEKNCRIYPKSEL